MNNMLHIVIVVFAVQAVALFVAMAFGRAAKAGDRFKGSNEFDTAGATPPPACREAVRVAQPAPMQPFSR